MIKLIITMFFILSMTLISVNCTGYYSTVEGEDIIYPTGAEADEDYFENGGPIMRNPGGMGSGPVVGDF